MERHSAYVRHPDDASLSKYVLTRIAQRRELRLQDIHELLQHECKHPLPSLAHKLTFKGASSSILEQERNQLQKELTLLLDCSFGDVCNGADSMQSAVHSARTPLAGEAGQTLFPDGQSGAQHVRPLGSDLAQDNHYYD